MHYKQTKSWKALQKKKAQITEELEMIQHEEAKMAAESVVISDHAFIRYVERVHPETYQKFIEEIVPEDVRLQIAKLGGKGKFPVGTSHVVALDNFVVKTVLPQ